MRESRIVKEWQDEAEERGRLKTLRDLLMRRLQKRFPNISSPDVTTAVQTQSNADELMRWLDLLDAAASLEAFRSSLNL